MQYIYILKEDGSRLTSLAIGVHGNNIEECKEYAKTNFPNNTILEGDDSFQDKFINGFIYKNGEFVKPKIDQTPIKIEEIKANLSNRISELESAMMKRIMADLPYDDIKKEYKAIILESKKQLKEISDGN